MVWRIFTRMTTRKNPSIDFRKNKRLFLNFLIKYFRMARASLMSNDVAIPTVSFHRRTFGQNIQLDDNGSKATRHTSFDNGYLLIIWNFIYWDFIVLGITFTSKQIKANERIYMKIIDIDESGQWLGSLAIGKKRIELNLWNLHIVIFRFYTDWSRFHSKTTIM
jgi:hypothetical protein